MLVLLSALLGGACNCEDEVIVPSLPGTCEPTYRCPTGFEYRLGDCRAARCSGDDECCPGQKCNIAAGFCADQYVACTRDADCGEIPGQRCIEIRDGRFCGYPNRGNVLSEALTQACATNADCSEGRTCVGKRCLTQAPCEGGCAEGGVCDLDTNKCYALQCPDVCPAGQIHVLADPDRMSGPKCCKLACECVTLPPVKPGQHGWYASLALEQEDVVVSAFDETYGDLVLARFDKNGNRKSLEYVDGFPTTGRIAGDPAGIRGGRNEPGPKVGEHTSIAVDAANTIHVAYYDAERGALMYAFHSGGRWTKTVVDDEGDTGLYTSLAIDARGNPSIAYMMLEGTIAPSPDKQSALKIARAGSNQPSAPSDWTTSVVHNVSRPVPICNGGCGRDQACVDLGMGPTCAPTTVGCGGCQNAESCVDTGMGMGACKARIAIVRSDDLPEGTGLFASLAYTSTGTPVIAFYNRRDRGLWLAKGDGMDFAVRRLAGGDMMSPRDVGQHASVAIGPNDQIVVAYMDATADDLAFMDVASGREEIVDNGVTPPNLRLVGADASLIFDAAGRPALAYQDPTNIDLLYARRTGTPPMWSQQVLRGSATGMMMGTASGFYVSQARRGDIAFVSNVDVTFTPEGDLSLDLRVNTTLID